MSKVKDTFFISHGAPTLSIDDSLPVRHFLKSFRTSVHAQKPSSILVISGHWETHQPTVNAVSGATDTIYDFYGFPEEIYKLAMDYGSDDHNSGDPPRQSTNWGSYLIWS